jgi:hypothetical protein
LITSNEQSGMWGSIHPKMELLLSDQVSAGRCGRMRRWEQVQKHNYTCRVEWDAPKHSMSLCEKCAAADLSVQGPSFIRLPFPHKLTAFTSTGRPQGMHLTGHP